jgi:hypothetical protein
MHDDDEERFPRISLWELLGGIAKGVARFAYWLILIGVLAFVLAQYGR